MVTKHTLGECNFYCLIFFWVSDFISDFLSDYQIFFLILVWGSKGRNRYVALETPLIPPPLHGKNHLKFPFWLFEPLPKFLSGFLLSSDYFFPIFFQAPRKRRARPRWENWFMALCKFFAKNRQRLLLTYYQRSREIYPFSLKKWLELRYYDRDVIITFDLFIILDDMI